MKNWEERTAWWLLDIFSGFGGFGHEVQDSLWYPGARELDRLLLAGWVVSRFGQGLVKQQGGQLDKWEFSIRQRYFYF